MADLYSKIMLTIIAAAVSIIAFKMIIAPDLCGTQENRCYIKGSVDIGTSPVAVEVTNDRPISVEVTK